MRTKTEILELLPYSEPFLFVDEIIRIDENSCEGAYHFKESLPFYRGHFKDNPVTPGVLLTECCAQIGLVCLGIFLSAKSGVKPQQKMAVVMTSAEMEYLRPVFPGQGVRVRSEKVYFRFEKLKCKVVMYDSEENVICKGIISGMLTTKKDE